MVDSQPESALTPRTIAALLLLAAAIWYAWSISARSQGLDFYQFWVGGQVAHREQAAPFYSADSRKALAREFLQRAYTTERSEDMLVVAQARPELELYSTPLLYTTFGVFGGHYERDLTVYRVVSLAAFVGALLLLGSISGYSSAASVVMAALVLLLFGPLHSDLRVTNVTSLQLLLIVLFLWRSSRRRTVDDVGAGAVLAVAILFKPNAALIVPFLLALRVVTRDLVRLRLEALGAAIATLVSIAGSSVFFRSSQIWLEWLQAVRALYQQHYTLAMGNVSPALPLVESIGPGAAWIALLVLSAIALFSIARRARAAKSDETLLASGLALLVMLLTSSLVWMHYLVLALPLGYALMKPLFDAQRPPALFRVRGVTAALAISFVAAVPWTPLLHVTSADGEALLFWLGLVLLFGVGVLSQNPLQGRRTAR